MGAHSIQYKLNRGAHTAYNTDWTGVHTQHTIQAERGCTYHTLHAEHGCTHIIQYRLNMGAHTTYNTGWTGVHTSYNTGWTWVSHNICWTWVHAQHTIQTEQGCTYHTLQAEHGYAHMVVDGGDPLTAYLPAQSPVAAGWARGRSGTMQLQHCSVYSPHWSTCTSSYTCISRETEWVIEINLPANKLSAAGACMTLRGSDCVGEPRP